MEMYQIPKKTAGQQVASWSIFMIIGLIGVYCMEAFGKVFFKPVQDRIKSDREKVEEEILHDTQKIFNRNRFHSLVRDDPSDPINQYIANPSDSKNQKWYKKYSEGKVFDRDLRWAPDFYDEIKGQNFPSAKFISYLENQIKLCNTPIEKELLIGAVDMYYPEIDPKWETLNKTIADLKKRSLNGKLFKILIDNGLPTDLSSSLLDHELPETEMKKLIFIAKACRTRNYYDEMINFCYVNQMDPNSAEAMAADFLFKYTGDEKVIKILSTHVTVEEILPLGEAAAVEVKETNCIYRQAFERNLKKLAYSIYSDVL
jgi:hypothetical protein